MRRYGLILAALFVVGIAVLGVATSKEPENSTGIGSIGTDKASYFYSHREKYSFGVYLVGSWGMSSRGSSNSATGTWSVDVTLNASGKDGVIVHQDSKNADRLTINDKTFDLAKGSMLRVDSDGRIEQLPFAPLRTTERSYVDRLTQFFAK